jgi:hypothetical protein
MTIELDYMTERALLAAVVEWRAAGEAVAGAAHEIARAALDIGAAWRKAGDAWADAGRAAEDGAQRH